MLGISPSWRINGLDLPVPEPVRARMGAPLPLPPPATRCLAAPTPSRPAIRLRGTSNKGSWHPGPSLLSAVQPTRHEARVAGHHCVGHDRDDRSGDHEVAEDGQCEHGREFSKTDGNGEVIFTRYSGHLSKLGMIRAEVMDGEYSTGIHG